MDIKFSGLYDLEDALVARAALDGMIAEYHRQSDGGTSLTEAMDGDELERIAAEVARELSDSLKPYVGNVVKGDEFVANVGSVTVEPVADEITTVSSTDPEPFTKEQIKAAAKFHPDLAALVSKRGKKTAEEKARIIALTAEVLNENQVDEQSEEAEPAEEPVGKVFEGASAEQLNAILEATTTPVTTTENVEVRTLPNFLTEANGGGQTEKVDEPQVTNSLESMPDEALHKMIVDYMQSDGGFFWFRNVVSLGGGDMNKLPREHMLKVLSDPAAFNVGG